MLELCALIVHVLYVKSLPFSMILLALPDWSETNGCAGVYGCII